MSIRPLPIRSPARVTMNEGRRSSVISKPWAVPKAMQNTRPATTAANQGQAVVPGCTSCTVIAAPVAPT